MCAEIAPKQHRRRPICTRIPKALPSEVNTVRLTEMRQSKIVFKKATIRVTKRAKKATRVLASYQQTRVEPLLTRNGPGARGFHRRMLVRRAAALRRHPD
jgi:hypothetical protein